MQPQYICKYRNFNTFPRRFIFATSLGLYMTKTSNSQTTISELNTRICHFTIFYEFSSTLYATFSFRTKARQYFHAHLTTTPALTASIPFTFESKNALLIILPNTSTRSIFPPSFPILRIFLEVAQSFFRGEIYPSLSTQNITHSISTSHLPNSLKLYN